MAQGRGMTMPNTMMRVICDNREGLPYDFRGLAVEVEHGTLASGDLTLAGFANRIALERKSLPDLIACLSGERERFERELQRLKAHDFSAVVVESPADDLRAGRYRSKMTPEAAWQSCLALMQRYRVAFVFCRDRRDAEETAFHLMRHFHHDRERELAALGGSMAEKPGGNDHAGRATSAT